MKHIDGELKHVNREAREIEFIASREVPDRDSEVILVRGIDTRPFMKNPTLLLQHDPSTRFGRVTSLRIEEVDGARALIGKAKILPPGVNDEADAAYEELRFGSLNGISIGFLIKEREGRTITKSELLEISVVTIPACPSCVVTQKHEGRPVMTVQDGTPVVVLRDDRPGSLATRLRQELPEPLDPTTYIDRGTVTRALDELLPEILHSLRPTIQQSITAVLDYHTGKVR